MNLKDYEVLEKVFQRKQARRTAPAVTPQALAINTIDLLVVLPPTLVDLPIAPLLAPSSMEGEVDSLVAQALPSLNSGSPEEILMEVENITTY